MNKKEKLAVCGLVAGWEFTQGGSVSEAAARYSCSHDIRMALEITDRDMAFHRMWEIATQLGDTSDEFTDLLFDAVSVDYEAVLDALEKGPDAVRLMVANSDCPACGGSGRMGPFFPGGLSTVCANCTPTKPKDNADG